jgi:hypothetical protein
MRPATNARPIARPAIAIAGKASSAANTSATRIFFQLGAK